MSYEDLFNFDESKNIFETCDVQLAGSIFNSDLGDNVTDVFLGLDDECRSELSSLSDADSKDSEPPEKPPRKKLIIGNHIKINEGGSQNFTCTICNCRFTRKQQIRYHDYCVTGKRPLKCDLCGKGFIKKSHLVYHMRTHTGESPFKCCICQKGFKQKAKLKRHEKTHGNDSRLECCFCKKSYSDKDSLRKHEQKHSEHTYKCKTCKKSYADKFALKQHLAIHNSPNFICDVCGKCFHRKNSLNVHKQIHEDLYPFECPGCHRTFRSRKELNHHSIVHDENNPGHECEICNITCGRRDNLLRHIRNCHLYPCLKKSVKGTQDIGDNIESKELGIKSNSENDSSSPSTLVHEKNEIKTCNNNNILSSSEPLNKAKSHSNSENEKAKISSPKEDSHQSAGSKVKKIKEKNNSAKIKRSVRSIKDTGAKNALNLKTSSVSANEEYSVLSLKSQPLSSIPKDPSNTVRVKEGSYIVPNLSPSNESNASILPSVIFPNKLEHSKESSEKPVGVSTYNFLNQTNCSSFPEKPDVNKIRSVNKTSVIMHTDLFKETIIAANSLREPVIKTLRLTIPPSTDELNPIEQL